MSQTQYRPEYPDAERKQLLEFVPINIQRLLDVGCSSGAFGAALKLSRSIEVWGVEPDACSAKIASSRLDNVINDYFCADIDLPTDYFDLITFNDSLEHMAYPVDALELCKSKLRSGGRIHCCVPNMRQIDNLEHLLLERDWKYEEMGIRDNTHLRFFTKKSIVRLFEEVGYQVVDVIGVGENWWVKSKQLRRLIFRLFPSFTSDMRYTQFLVIAEKD